MEKILLDSGPSPHGWHAIEVFNRCNQLFANVYERGLHRRSRATSLGGLIHVGAAHHYAQVRAGQRGEDPSRYYDPIDAVQLSAKQAGSEEYGVLAYDVVKRYQACYAKETMKVLHVEEIFTVTIRNKWPFTQRYDRVMEDTKGMVYIYDLKSTSNISEKTKLSYGLSGQLLSARVIGNALWGRKFGGVRLDFVSTTPKDSEPFRYAMRRDYLPPAPVADAGITDTIARSYEAMDRLRAENIPLDKWPKALSEHTCFTRYGVCPFYDACRWGFTRSQE